jgi:glycosyltransferase involved in cell wall biosynthesis
MVNKSPKISVITVCFNVGSKLNRTIQSVLEQTYLSVEYIIIDGGSKDSTLDIISSFEKEIDYIISEPDAGIYDAMNKGINLATGDLIIFLNAGDYFVTKNVLEFMISKMNLKDADLFFARIVWNDPKTKDIVLSDHNWVNFTWDFKDSNFPHPATVYKKILFNDIGLFNLDFPIAADYEWNVRALVSNKIKFQYINIIITVFFADGISNDLNYEIQHKSELNQINDKHFRHIYLCNKLSKTRKIHFRTLCEKVASKMFNCRLARIY